MTSLTESPRIPGLVTAGPSTTESSKRKLDAARPSFWRSAAARITLLLVAFVSFPAIAYRQLPALDAIWTQPSAGRVALAYLALMVIAFGVVLGLVRNLRRLDVAVRSIRVGAPAAVSFDRFKRVPELAGIADEFGRMAGSLRSAAEAGRLAAEENAHAFKTPIATIAHALMPLRSAVAADSARARRSLDLIEQTTAKLHALVVAARRMEQVRCRVLHPPRWRLDLGTFVRDAVASKRALLDDPRLPIGVNAASSVHVYGNDDILRTIVDNTIDNAVHAAAPQGSIVISVEQRDDEAVLCIEDNGPGLPTEMVERVFEPFASYRPGTAPAGAEDLSGGEPSRFGIGLWTVRCNVEALGGQVRAENRAKGGLRLVITLPLA